MLTEHEAALTSQVDMLKAELIATKDAAHAAINAAYAETAIAVEYAEELAEATGGIDTVKEIVRQHRLRSLQRQHWVMKNDLIALESLIEEVQDGG